MGLHRTAILNEIREKIATFSAGPGVYFFKGVGGVVLYIGKAKSLRPRVASYFQPGANLAASRGADIQRMIEALVVDVDVMECESEVEALLRENRLIKDIQPRYNDRLKDGKSFPYLQITTGEDFPRISVTRQPEPRAKLYGPFVSPGELRSAIPLLQRVFKFRTCKLEIDAADNRRRYQRPCILHAIKQCAGPCGDRVSQEDYSRQIRHLRAFLDSKGSTLRRSLQARMKQAAADRRFEKAAEIRDELKALDGLQKRGLVREHDQPENFAMNIDPAEGLEKLAQVLDLPTPPRTIEGIDIAHLQGKETCGSLVCFIDGRAFKPGYRRFKLRVGGNDDFASIREVVSRRYRAAVAGEELFPDIILIDGGKGQLSAAWSAFDDLPKDVTPPVLLSLAKKEELIYEQGRVGPVRLSRHNPALRLLQAVRDESHRFAQAYHHLLRKKAVLGK